MTTSTLEYTFVFRWDGRYFGFIHNGYLFTKEGKYFGWVEEKDVWRADGTFWGEIFDNSYILRRALSVPPMPRTPRIPPVPMLPPVPPLDKPGRPPVLGWEDPGVIWVDAEAEFRSEVWNVFHSLVLGYKAFVYPTNYGDQVWMIPPDVRYARYFANLKAAEFLIENGLAEQKGVGTAANSPIGAKAIIGLTEKGQALSAAMGEQPFAEGAKLFWNYIPLPQTERRKTS